MVGAVFFNNGLEANQHPEPYNIAGCIQEGRLNFSDEECTFRFLFYRKNLYFEAFLY